ncbi:MAG: phosphate/phosphite/phosphonate ABC transporter substrate-binding protein [Nitrospirae bacterium]|nr:phosphate/phosphite/phosphonate ABC transporter substrate-binding protein [Nitrospirota bacterium]
MRLKANTSLSFSKFKFFVFIFSLLTSLLCRPGISNAQESLILGIHPYLPATELIDRFTLLARYLSEKTGQPVKLEIAKDYKDHIDKIGKDKLDIAFMGPASYVKMVSLYGKKPILARLEISCKPTFRGIIIVKKESPLHSLEDLKGKSFAFADSESTMGHLIPRFVLLEAGVRVEDLASHAFLTNHNSIALGVLMGNYDAGAVKEDVFYEYKKRGLKELASTPEISEHVFVTCNSLPTEKVRTLQEALYHLKDDKKGRKILSALRDNLTGMVPAVDKDYDSLRIILQGLEKEGVK